MQWKIKGVFSTKEANPVLRVSPLQSNKNKLCLYSNVSGVITINMEYTEPKLKMHRGHSHCTSAQRGMGVTKKQMFAYENGR